MKKNYSKPTINVVRIKPEHAVCGLGTGSQGGTDALSKDNNLNLWEDEESDVEANN